jgi:hypothetical protein
MIGKKWSLWSFILRRLAKAKGFLDPTVVFARLQRFSQPSEVWVPTELLRSGAVLQARGLINSQAIQHNLEWIWPFWVERQFNPKDEAFIPRAFSMTHINLTHRNWTAIGLPDFADLPIVDPRGLLTPFFDGWSLDGWIVSEKFGLIPSRLADVHQEIGMDGGVNVVTTSKKDYAILEVRSEVKTEGGFPVCETSFKAVAPAKAWLVLSVRPYNPEGISAINDIRRLPKEKHGWNINDHQDICLASTPQQYVYSTYDSRDIYDQVHSFPTVNSVMPPETDHVHCRIGMASAAALYPLEPGIVKEVVVRVPLSKTEAHSTSWVDHLDHYCQLKIPDKKFKFLYDVALRTLILHSPKDVVYPGPFTYKRFWFRDAAFILNAMITTGLLKNVEKIIDQFPTRQEHSGYYLSQDGEWDSNGQALWIMQRYLAMTNTTIKPEWLTSAYQAARWIQWKRLSNKEKAVHAGLMPAGFSAEHFGPSDFYYWDDFWSVAGLQAASRLAAGRHPDLEKRFRTEADDLSRSIEKSLSVNQAKFGHSGLPASPYRRMDAGSIGTLVAGYPLQLWPAHEARILETVHFLLKKHVLHGGFYHEISHSGINVYLTLHIAQVLLRAGDRHFLDIVEAVAHLATPTGQWPEAIHPHTRGGCMGDGQHVWAAAEWVLMIRNMFVREEESTKTLILCSGISPAWIKENETLFLGPVLTVFGKISITVKVGKDREIYVSWNGFWYKERPSIEVHWPGQPPETIPADRNFTRIKLSSSARIPMSAHAY